MSWVWFVYGSALMAWTGKAYKDWHDPEEDRKVTLILAGIFAAVFAVAAVLIAVLT